ncbi:MAG TPA: polysaccharide deacetylase family protein [Myxococcales bacterium]|jgi:peptidoglycan/xylan/chitin deacetylase (PgdA/CDA1 family)
MGWGSFGRSAAKAVAAGALHYSGLQRVLSRASRIAAGGRRVLILSYHRVVEDFESESRRVIPGLLVSRATFERHLDELGRGYDIVPLDEALDVVAGRGRPRRDVAVITFDDGYQDVYEHAFPVLRRRGLPATVYLATRYVGSSERFLHDRLYRLLRTALEADQVRPGRNVLAGSMAAQAASVVDQLISTRPNADLEELVARLESGLGRANLAALGSGSVMTWDQARAMSRAGIVFGGHTVRHVVLTHESEEAIERELSESKADLERELGVPAVHFAYPNGFYDRRVVTALVRLGYRSAVTTEDLPNQVGGDPFRLRRKTLWENFSRGPFGYSATLTSCHLDDVFTLLALTRPVKGERTRELAPSGAEA